MLGGFKGRSGHNPVLPSLHSVLGATGGSGDLPRSLTAKGTLGPVQRLVFYCAPFGELE